MTAGRRVVPGRITMALDLRGLYGPQVDAACGTREPHVDRWEAGHETPTPEQLLLLAQLTGFPVEFFHLPMEASNVTAIVCARTGPGRGCHTHTVNYNPTAPVTPISQAAAHHDGRLF